MECTDNTPGRLLLMVFMLMLMMYVVLLLITGNGGTEKDCEENGETGRVKGECALLEELNEVDDEDISS